MASLESIVAAASAELNLTGIPDYPEAHNGLQLANETARVTRIVAAVDACLPVIRQAVARGGDLLIVHHGLFWSGAQKIVGAQYEKLRMAIENNLAIFSAHIPLDVHPEIGNNARLAAALGFRNTESFFEWKGILLGLRARTEIGIEDLIRKVTRATGAAAHLCPGGPEIVREVGMVTGAAGAEIAAAAEAGIDTFITGEGPHWSYTAAEELGVNLIYGGHYATETFGVKALSERLAEQFAVPWEFVDHPTGL